MKLANKYELFDPVTTGRVETFVAQDLASRERVLAFIFEGGQSPEEPPSAEQILQAFCGMAPPPPAAVIDAGRYGGTSFAYLVTKVPEADTLQDWVAAYESHTPTAPKIQTSPAVEAPRSTASDPRIRTQAPEPGPITRAFSPPPKPAEATAAKPLQPDTSSVPPGDRIPTRPKESFTGVFQSAAIPAEPGSGGRVDEAKPGEFTSFFRGPFTAQASPVTPTLTPPASEPENRPGDFTQIFGGVRQSPKEVPVEPPVRSEAPLNEPGGFTQLFAAPVSTPASFRQEPPAFPKEEAPKAESTLVFDKPAWEPQAPSSPPPAPPALDSLPAGIPPLPTSGPSEYTMFVSGGMRSPNAPDEPPIPGGTSPPGSKPAAVFGMPKVPSVPPMPVPKIPPTPVPPAPKMPTLAAPKVPEAPAAPRPQMPYLPLILIMTVLFFIGAILVLYFALKH